jgi:hypothetical protein
MWIKLNGLAVRCSGRTVASRRRCVGGATLKEVIGELEDGSYAASPLGELALTRFGGSSMGRLICWSRLDEGLSRQLRILGAGEPVRGIERI